MSTRRLRATPQRDGYGRYFRFKNAPDEIPGDSFLCVNFDLWATEGDTPLWLRIHKDVPVNADKLRDGVRSLVERETGDYAYDVPIHLATGVEYASVLDDVVRQVREISNMVKEP